MLFEGITRMAILSPYAGRPVSDWSAITQQLIAAHPLTPQAIHELVIASWGDLWCTSVGGAQVNFPLEQLNPPATVIGYFFEKLFAKNLANRYPNVWRGGAGSEKDLHCLTDPSKSIEIKASGQLGYKIFGNRSYGQEVENADAAKKDKSGYYITINFYGMNLTCIRFGWIDADDWQAQRAATGQMAGLKPEVYQYKLHTIVGEYMAGSPIQLVDGVGPVAASSLNQLGIYYVGQLIAANNLPANLLRFQQSARQQFQGAF